MVLIGPSKYIKTKIPIATSVVAGHTEVLIFVVINAGQQNF
jgi:hypothetical protein